MFQWGGICLSGHSDSFEYKSVNDKGESLTPFLKSDMADSCQAVFWFVWASLSWRSCISAPRAAGIESHLRVAWLQCEPGGTSSRLDHVSRCWALCCQIWKRFMLLWLLCGNDLAYAPSPWADFPLGWGGRAGRRKQLQGGPWTLRVFYSPKETMLPLQGDVSLSACLCQRWEWIWTCRLLVVWDEQRLRFHQQAACGSWGSIEDRVSVGSSSWELMRCFKSSHFSSEWILYASSVGYHLTLLIWV